MNELIQEMRIEMRI